MKCPQCQTENPDTKKFCRECGAKLSLACPKCESEVLPGDRFCGECGHNLTIPPEPPPKDLSFDEKIDKIQRYLPKGLTEKILSQRGRIEGERKQVTVMFCDMEGFTRLTERLGPEEAYNIMDEIYEILIHKVHDYEGTVNEMTGDGIMALFGAPIALEDAPQRAIRSAYAIHKEMAKFSDSTRHGKKTMSPLKMRIGIHTGPVVVGTLGNDLRVEFKAVGDTVNLASRMEGMAEPGTTFVSEETFRLTEGLFRFEALGEKMVKGKGQPIRVYQLIGPSTSRTRFDVSAERGLTPFVGRGRELELFLDALDRARKGRGQALSVVGEAGVGKSRFLYEFRKAVSEEDVTFLEGRCLSYRRNVAYHPITDILKSNFDIRENDRDAAIIAKIKRGLKILGVGESSTLPYFLELLSVKDSGIDRVSLTPEEIKDQITEALKRIALKGSEIRPLILVYEDLHWIDPGSEDVLKAVLESIPGARVLLIFTYRPEFVHTWGGRSYHSQVTLNRLSNREVFAMVAHLLGTEDLAWDLEEFILEKAEGIPFFIEEFIKSLKEGNIIEKKDDTFYLTNDVQEVAIPSTIKDVIMARVDSLPDGAKEVLQTGSVIEREFSYELIRRITDLSEQDLLSHLSALKDMELLYERGIYPESTFIFKHALTQEIAYDSLLVKRRKVQHGLVGNAIEELYQDRIEGQVNALSYHFSHAENWAKAVLYGRKAAERANKFSQFQETIKILEEIRDWLLRLPVDRFQQETLVDIQLEMLWPVYYSGQLDRMIQICREAESVALTLNDRVRLGNVFWGYGIYYFLKGEHKQVEPYCLKALEQLEGTSADSLTTFIQYWLATSYQSQGQWKKAEPLFLEGVRYQEEQNTQTEYLYKGLGFLPYVQGCVLVGYNLAVQGRTNEAKELFRKSYMPAVREASNLYTKTGCAVWHSRFSALIGEDYGAAARADEALEITKESDSPVFRLRSFDAKGKALMALGQYEIARTIFEQALEAIGDKTYRVGLAGVYFDLVQVNLELGDQAEAERYYQAALPLIKSNPDRIAPRFDFLKGRLLASADPPNFKQSKSFFERSIHAEEEANAVVLAAQTRFYLAQVLAREGEVDRSRNLLEQIYCQFQNWEISVWQKKCEEALKTI